MMTNLVIQLPGFLVYHNVFVGVGQRIWSTQTLAEVLEDRTAHVLGYFTNRIG